MQYDRRTAETSETVRATRFASLASAFTQSFNGSKEVATVLCHVPILTNPSTFWSWQRDVISQCSRHGLGDHDRVIVLFTAMDERQLLNILINNPELPEIVDFLQNIHF